MSLKRWKWPPPLPRRPNEAAAIERRIDEATQWVAMTYPHLFRGARIHRRNPEEWPDVFAPGQHVVGFFNPRAMLIVVLVQDETTTEFVDTLVHELIHRRQCLDSGLGRRWRGSDADEIQAYAAGHEARLRYWREQQGRQTAWGAG